MSNVEMMNTEIEQNQKVSVKLRDYNEMLWKSKLLDVFLQALYEKSELNYSGDKLRFDDDFINAFLCGIDTFNYQSRIAELVHFKELREIGGKADE